MKYVVTMRTFNRSPKKNYVTKTVESLRVSGFFKSDINAEFHVFDSGSEDWSYLDTVEDCAYVHVPEKRLTPNVNAGVALYTPAKRVKCDWVIFLEDDIIFCKNWIEGIDRWLQQFARADRRVYTFYTPYKEVESRFNMGISYWEYLINKYYGSQCFALRRADAESLGAYFIEKKKYKKANKCADLLMKLWHRDNYPSIDHFLASAPCFVQHVGRDSYLNAGRFHSSNSFQGTKWSYYE